VSASNIGSSSGSVSGASSSGVSGGSSALTSQILSSVGQVGSAIQLAASGSNVSVPSGSLPKTNSAAVSNVGATSSEFWIVAVIVVILAIVAFREL